MSSNPYTPPRAAVSDVGAVDEYQEVRLWSASGRIGRLRYLAHITGAYLIFGALVMLISALLRSSESATLVLYVLYIPMAVFAILAAIKRSHDMDWSGWTVLLMLIPLVGFIWIFKPGTEGENTYGHPAPPNTTGVKILGFMFPVIVILGILAAIAIPAYVDYTRRAAGY